MQHYINQHLSEPWFTLIKNGQKTVEGRTNHGDFLLMSPEDTIQFYNDDNGEKRTVKVKIEAKRSYETFKQVIKQVGVHIKKKSFNCS